MAPWESATEILIRIMGSRAQMQYTGKILPTDVVIRVYGCD